MSAGPLGRALNHAPAQGVAGKGGRMRAQVTQRPTIHRLLLTAVILMALFTSMLALMPRASAATANPIAADAAAAWLLTQQRGDGGFASFGGESDVSATADAVVALAAAGLTDSDDVDAAIAYLNRTVADSLDNPGRLAKIILARIAVGLPASPDGLDLPGTILASQGDNGWFGTSFYGHAIALLGLEAAGVALPTTALAAVDVAQSEDGAWGFNGEPILGTGDSNTTATVIMALAAADATGEMGENIATGLAYLMRIQTGDGSMPYDQATAAFGGDANSTALAVQAFIAAGSDPDSLANGSLLDALATLQNDSGAFAYQSSFPDDSLLATVQAIPALLLLPLPIIGEPQVDEPVDPALIAAAMPVAANADADCVYYEVTQHNVCGEIATYWAANGGLPTFGYPLTELVTTGGETIQYFERAVLGLHTEWAGTPWVVLPTLIGVEAAARDGVDTAPAGDANNGTCAYFAETQHNLCAGFRAYWEAEGGLGVYGFPLTEEFSLEDGTVVQYFERARFEWKQGSWPERFDVLLTRLGADELERDLTAN